MCMAVSAIHGVEAARSTAIFTKSGDLEEEEEDQNKYVLPVQPKAGEVYTFSPAENTWKYNYNLQQEIFSLNVVLV